MTCEECRNRRICRNKAAHKRDVFFAMGRGEVGVCKDFEPAYFRGIEGVKDHGYLRRA